MRAIYIILMGLPCWPVYRGGYRLGLYYLIPNDGLTLLILVWALTVIGVGRRPSSNGMGRPSAKFPWSQASRPGLPRSRPGLPRSRPGGSSAKSLRSWEGLDQVDPVSGRKTRGQSYPYRYTKIFLERWRILCRCLFNWESKTIEEKDSIILTYYCLTSTHMNNFNIDHLKANNYIIIFLFIL